jgi:hypothetical protein
MVQVSYPGVYIVEKPSGVHTITGVSTSITAFLGQAREGPINKPVRVLSFAKFEKVFGQPLPDVDLSMAVRLFFQNGGSDCYVVRLSEKGQGSKASLILKNQASSPIDILKFTAKEIGTWGNDVCLDIDYNTPNPGDTFHLRIFRISSDGTILEDEKFLNCTMDYDSPRFPPKLITQNSSLVDCELQGFATLNDYKNDVTTNGLAFSEGRRFFNDVQELVSILGSLPQNDPVKFGVIIDNNAPFEITISNSEYSGVNTEASFKALLNGKFLGTNIPAALRGAVEATFRNLTIGGNSKIVLRLQTKPLSQFKKVSVIPGSSNDMTEALMLGTSQGGLEESSHAFHRPAPNGIFFDTNNQNLDKLAELRQDFFDTFTIDGKDVVLGIKLQTTLPSDLWYKAGPNHTLADDGVREKLSILAQEINKQVSGWMVTVSGLRLLIKKKTGPANDVPTVSTSLSSPPTANNIGPFFQLNSRLYTLGGPTSPFTGAANLGTEGRPPKLDDFIGNEVDHTGLYALDDVDLFNILVIPDDRSDTTNALTDDAYMSLWAPASVYCKNHRAILLVGPPRQWSSFEPADILEHSSQGIRSLRTGVVLDHSAVYYPRLVISENGLARSIDPCGAIAGIMARTDQAIGVWKAPAGLKADFQGRIFDVESSLSDPENGILNKEAINCLRMFPSGLVCWGARTMIGTDDSSEVDWRYVPVRRLALYIEESLYRGTKFAVFEPNDEPLWAQLRGSVTSFMRKLFKAQALAGRTEDEAFIIKCDRETTTPEDQNQGIVNIIVYWAPVKSAEFIITTIQQMAREA